MKIEKLNITDNRYEFIALAALVMALNALAIDIMLPALPDIGDAIAVVSENHRQYVITSFLIGFGISQLFFGPLCDAIGRRKTFFIGVTIYIIAALLGSMTESFTAMVTMRVIQGVGAGATRVVALSMVRDSFAGRAMAEVMSLIMMVFMVMPVLAPAFGQLIILVGPWQWIYIAMAVIALIALVWVTIRLPETLKPENRRPYRPDVVIDGFRIVFTNRSALMYGLANMVKIGALFGFLAASQQIYGELYGLGALFPVAFGFIALVMASASFVNSRYVGRFGMRLLSHSALLGFVALSAVWSILAYFDALPLWLFIALQAPIMFLFGLTGTNFNSLAMEPLGRVAGTAASVFGFMQTAGGAVLGTLVGQSYDGTVLPIALGYLIFGSISVVLVLIAENGTLFQAHNDPI
ncbi:multidrug effflux MFS transporter [uncultured Maritalea sp.]|jgi:DHA1 family bicyclomycin/chloramphenicol resistance-like MFS transporter|uniref:multidrug effflux MFS transporter n=1 Tax=uncultured Maritalea sp. TaxID=757249 RepID=UPI002630B1FC|nr:multidrug effflux MFS transporter [uncultured Maritalea sp.]